MDSILGISDIENGRHADLIVWEGKYDRTSEVSEYKYVMDPETPEGKIELTHIKYAQGKKQIVRQADFDDVDAALDCFDEIELGE